MRCHRYRGLGLAIFKKPTRVDRGGRKIQREPGKEEARVNQVQWLTGHEAAWRSPTGVDRRPNAGIAKDAMSSPFTRPAGRSSFGHQILLRFGDRREKRMPYRRPTICLALASAVSVIVATASAAAPSVQTDAQCLVLSNALSNTTKDQNAQQALFAAHFFYLGRLRVEIGNDKLPAAIADAEKSLKPDSAGPMMQACGTGVQDAETAAENAGKSLHPTPGK